MNQNLIRLENVCISKIKQNKETLNKTGYYSFLLQTGDLIFEFDIQKKDFQVRQLIRRNGNVTGNEKAHDFPLLNNSNIYKELESLANDWNKKYAEKELAEQAALLDKSINHYLQILK